MRMIAAAILALALAATAHPHEVLAHEVKQGALTLSNLQVRATVAGLPTSAAYLTIANSGKTADKLLSIDCACATSAMMHESRTQNGISSMTMLSEVAIPAGGKVTFRPDGLHVMLVGLKGPLKAGALQPMTLRFQKAGVVKAGFHVRDVIKPPGAPAGVSR
jgi:copper(I)-binding protein